MNFLPCSFPHNDFLLLGGEAGHSVTALAGLKRHVTEDATIFHNVEGDPGRTVSGVIIRDRTLELGEYHPERNEVLTGRYCGIRPVDNGPMGLELVADELGTIPIYYAKTAKGPMASNSIRLIALAMKAAGVPVKLSLGSIASTWFTDNYLCFSQTSKETYVEGVFLGLLGQRIIFRGGQMSVSPAPPPQGEPPKIEEYRYLLDRGIEEIRENVLAVINAGLPVFSTLTGGRDSRMVLGALLSLGRERDVLFQTNDVNEDDTNISTALAGYFKLAYATPPERVRRVGQSFDDDLQHFTLANMGAKTLYKQANVSLISDELSVALIGGSGELYRTVFTKGLNPKLLQSNVHPASIRKWLRNYKMFHKMPQDIRDLIVEQWLSVFRDLGARSIREAIDLHYANFRNRHHLGAPTQYRKNEKNVLFSPAASVSLYQLARRIPGQAIESDRLVYDITRALNFDLAHLPYDKPLFLRNPSVAQRAQATQDNLIDRFHPDPDRLKMPPPKTKEFSGEQEDRDFREFCITSIETELDLLQEHDVARQLVTDDFRRLIGSRLQSIKMEGISTWLGKFRAARMVAELSS